jgi:hypothetical protein
MNHAALAEAERQAALDDGEVEERRHVVRGGVVLV